MIKFNLVLQSYDTFRVNAADLQGPPLNFKEINSKLSKLTSGRYQVKKPTLRSYQYIGLVDKPKIKGRDGYYPGSTVYSLLAIRQLRMFHEYSTEDILNLISSSHHIYVIYLALENLVGKLLYHTESPKVANFFSEIEFKYHGIRDPDEEIDIKTTLGYIQALKAEWQGLVHHTLRARKDSLLKLRSDFENAIMEQGWDPKNVDIEFE